MNVLNKQRNLKYQIYIKILHPNWDKIESSFTNKSVICSNIHNIGYLNSVIIQSVSNQINRELTKDNPWMRLI